MKTRPAATARHTIECTVKWGRQEPNNPRNSPVRPSNVDAQPRGHPAQDQRKEQSAFFAKTIYEGRARIEQAFGRLKRLKRAALQCENAAQTFVSIVSFAAGLRPIKFVHTAQSVTETYTFNSNSKENTVNL
jgi:hypothetical protein